MPFTDSSVPDKIIHITNPEERKKWLVFGELHCGCWNKIYKRELIEQANVQFAEHVIYEEPLFILQKTTSRINNYVKSTILFLHNRCEKILYFS